MVKIQKQLANNKNHYGKGNPATSITIHETDNWSYGADATMHAKYVNGASTSTYHYVVDDKVAIQLFEHDIRCWHAGDGRTRNGGNLTSIAIEICVNKDGNYKKAVQNAVELVKHLMKVENIPSSKVFQHNHWSGKNCPRALRHGRNGINWKQFKKLLDGKTTTVDTTNIDDLVRRTIAGEFGNGSERKRKLGKNYNEVQKIINRGYQQPSVNINDLVRRTLSGEFGNGEIRKRKLGKHYNQVQREINKLYQ